MFGFMLNQRKPRTYTHGNYQLYGDGAAQTQPHSRDYYKFNTLLLFYSCPQTSLSPIRMGYAF